MKIIFFGTGKFGLPTLDKLVKGGQEVVAIVTGPDKKVGRGWHVRTTPIKAYVDRVDPLNVVFQPEKVSDPSFILSLKGIEADVFVVVDYGKLLSREILDMPGKYCVNLHPSLLPKYRGASPVNRAILNGDKETGNTVIRMSERMDAGSIMAQEITNIEENENAIMLHERLSRSGAELVVKVLEQIDLGREQFREQDEDRATYAPRLRKSEGKIDWVRSAEEIVRKVRGMQPWPEAFTCLDGKILKILEAEIADIRPEDAVPGAVCDEEEFVVSAGEGTVRINVLQFEGKKSMYSENFLRGRPVKKGTVLG
ncbi:MAG: methionyl-tRNA formyltransferase [Candidatus Omnitrophota bacterium]|nr:methionyl-tRNA formyltransferase [Candidatus Omnitrophota bacterium]